MKRPLTTLFLLGGIFLPGGSVAQGPPRPAGLAPAEPNRQPRFVTAAQASFLKDSDRMLGVHANNVAKAYLASGVAFHHIIEDTLGSMPILVTWCQLCNTALVFRADLEGRRLTFDLNGTRGSNFVMRDRQTGTDWQQATGEAFAGPLQGRRLSLLAFEITTWGEWKSRYPQTLAFAMEPRYREQYRLMEQRQKELTAFGAPAFSPLRTDSRLWPTTQVLGVEIGGAYKAYPITLLSKQSVWNDRIGSAPVLLLHMSDTETNRAFSRVISGQTLTFQSINRPAVSMTDLETGSYWNRYGECLEGALKGKSLAPISLLPSFWFAWAEFHPDTELFSDRPQ